MEGLIDPKRYKCASPLSAVAICRQEPSNILCVPGDQDVGWRPMLDSASFLTSIMFQGSFSKRTRKSESMHLFSAMPVTKRSHATKIVQRACYTFIARCRESKAMSSEEVAYREYFKDCLEHSRTFDWTKGDASTYKRWYLGVIPHVLAVVTAVSKRSFEQRRAWKKAILRRAQEPSASENANRAMAMWS